MTEDKLKEIIRIPEPLEGSTNRIGIFLTEEIQKQTEDLRKAVNGYLQIIKWAHDPSVKRYCIKLIEQITGKPYSDIGEDDER